MPNTTPEVAEHFTPLGKLDLTQEDGTSLGVEWFSCNSCGSVIAVRMKHWAIHQAIPEIAMD